MAKEFKAIVAVITLVTLPLFSSDIFLHQFFNKTQCDQILNNKGYFKTCYSYKYKAAKYVAYTLDGNLVGKTNIKKRPRFYPDLNIPKRYRAEYSDYTRNIYHQDRGHLANDAAFDYSKKSLHSVYVLSNIIPQYYKVNGERTQWAGVERYARYVAKKLGKVNVLNGVIYGNNPKRIGYNQIAVPKAYWKMIYNKKKDFEKCFYFKNEKWYKNPKHLEMPYSIRNFVVDCAELLNRHSKQKEGGAR